MATVNWNNPGNSTNYLNVLGELKDRDENLATMDFSGDSNVFTNALQWDNTNGWFEKYNGATFDKILPEGDAAELLGKSLDDTGVDRGSLYEWDGSNFTESRTRGAMYGGVATGSSSDYTISTGLGISTLAAGMRFSFEANHTNDDVVTIDVDSAATKSINKHAGLVGLVEGDIVSGGLYTVQYDGTLFHLVNPELPRILHRDTATVETASTTSETAYNYTIPANVLGATGGVRFRLLGAYQNNSGSSRNYTFKSEIGTTVLFTEVQGSNSSTNWGAFEVEATVVNKTASTQTSYTNLRSNDAGTADASAGNAAVGFVSHAVDSASEDSTSALAVEINVAMNFSASTVKWQKYLFEVELF